VQGSDLLHLGFGFGADATNNGNMLQQTIWAPDNGSGSPWQVTQDYTYDAVNRLATATETLDGTTQWSRTFSYDHFGNRWISGATGHTLHMATPTSLTTIQAATNRLTGSGITYDNAGNLTAHPNITTGSGSMMIYDANNKMTAFTATGVSVATKYDAAGRRVRKLYNSKTTVWVYDAFGKLAAEYTTEAQTVAAGIFYRTTDHLGSTRLTTDDSGDVVSRRDLFPFGERIDSTLSGRSSVGDGGLASFQYSPGMRQQFTGQQRDEETGLDYFWARNYHPALGRFLSVDPGGAGIMLLHPRTLDAYSYVSNTPLKIVDPTGAYGVCAVEYLDDFLWGDYDLDENDPCGDEGSIYNDGGNGIDTGLIFLSGSIGIGGGGSSSSGGGGTPSVIGNSLKPEGEVYHDRRYNVGWAHTLVTSAASVAALYDQTRKQSDSDGDYPYRLILIGRCWRIRPENAGLLGANLAVVYQVVDVNNRPYIGTAPPVQEQNTILNEDGYLQSGNGFFPTQTVQHPNGQGHVTSAFVDIIGGNTIVNQVQTFHAPTAYTVGNVYAPIQIIENGVPRGANHIVQGPGGVTFNGDTGAGLPDCPESYSEF